MISTLQKNPLAGRGTTARRAHLCGVFALATLIVVAPLSPTGAQAATVKGATKKKPRGRLLPRRKAPPPPPVQNNPVPVEPAPVLSAPVTAPVPAPASAPVGKAAVDDTSGEENDDVVDTAPAPEPDAIVLEDQDKNLSGFYFALGAGALYAVNGLLELGGEGGLELGFRPKFWERRLGFSLEPTFIYLRTLSAGGISASAIGTAPSLLLSLNFKAGKHLFRLFAGPSVAWLSVSATGNGGSTQEAHLLFGGKAGLAFLFRLPRGFLGLDVSYRLLPYSVRDDLNLANAVGGGLVYLLPL